MYRAAPNVAGVYLIANTATGEVYVGSTRRIRARLQWHRNQLRNGKHSSPALQRAWDGHGEQSFKASILSFCEVGQLRDAERAAIAAYGAAEGCYNTNALPGPGRCMPHSEATKKKISAGNKGKGGRLMRGVERPAHVKEIMKAHAFSGTPTKEVQEAAWAANKGNTYRLGKTHDEATRAAMSAKTRGDLHPRAILTEKDIPRIRELRAQGQSGPAIAGLFNVHHDTIYKALNGKTWRHVA